MQLVPPSNIGILWSTSIMSLGTGFWPIGQRPSGSAQIFFCRARSSSMCFWYESRVRLTLANWNGNSSTTPLEMLARSLPCVQHIPLVSALLHRCLVHPSYLHQWLLYFRHIVLRSNLWRTHKLQVENCFSSDPWGV